MSQDLNRTLFHRLGVKIVSSDSFAVNSYWAHRLLYFRRLFDLLQGTEGDIVECGVSEGMSLIAFGILNKESIQQRHIIGFDSFEGFPKLSKNDIAYKGTQRMFNQVTKARTLSNLASAGFSGHQVTLEKGWFSNTLPLYKGAIALLHLDADLYESTKCALDNLWDKVVIGGIVAFDEYHIAQWAGEKTAVDEFLERHKQTLLKDSYTDYHYIVKRLEQ